MLVSIDKSHTNRNSLESLVSIKVKEDWLFLLLFQGPLKWSVGLLPLRKSRVVKAPVPLQGKCQPAERSVTSQHSEDLPGGSDGKMTAYKAGDPGSTPGLGRSPGEENGNPFQYSCLESPMDRGTWWATVHGVAKSQTRLNDFTAF